MAAIPDDTASYKHIGHWPLRGIQLCHVPPGDQALVFGTSPVFEASIYL